MICEICHERWHKEKCSDISVDRDKLKNLTEDQDRAIQFACVEIDRLKAELERAIWNLAGCSTYAMGYGINEGHNKELALPALDDVLRLSKDRDLWKSRCEKTQTELEKWQHSSEHIALALKWKSKAETYESKANKLAEALTYIQDGETWSLELAQEKAKEALAEWEKGE